MDPHKPRKMGAVMAVLALTLPAVAAAQTRPFVTFATEEGLSQLIAQTLFEDQQGNILVGTEGGLHVLRGDRFVEVAIDDQLGRSVEDIVAGPDGQLWVGTQDGLYLGRPQGGWKKLGRDKGLEVPQVRSLHACSSGLWVGTAAGLFRLTDDRFQRVTAIENARISGIDSDHREYRWVGSERGLFIYDGKAWTKLSPEPVYGLTANPNGRGVWVSFKDRIELRFSGRTERTIKRAISAWTGAPRKIAVDRFGVVWAGTDEGVLEIDGDDQQLWGPDNGQKIQLVSSILEDREGGLWFAGTGGVSNLPDRSFVTYRRRDGLPSNNVRPVVRSDDGRLFVGTVRGLALRNAHKSGPQFRAVPGLNATVHSLAKGLDGSLWIGTAEGIYRWTPGRGLRRDKTWRRKGMVASIAAHPDGSLWVGGYGEVGLVRRSPEGDQSIQIPDQKLLYPRLLVAKDGRVWVGGANGLSVWDGEDWKTYRVEDGLARSDPYFIAEDRLGRIWFGYFGPNGVTRFDGQTFRTFTEADGLSSNRVFSIGEEQDGRMWFGTARGVDCFDGKRFVNFRTADGYPSSESNAGGFLLDRDGSLWLSTIDGLAHFRPDRAPNPLRPPDVRLLRLRANASPLKSGSTVEITQPDLTAEYITQARLRRSHIDVRYRVKGLFDAWTPAQDERVVVARLPPGEYTFEMDTRRRPGAWHRIATTPFTLRAPVWTQSWVWGVTILPVVALSWVLMRLRLRRSTVLNARLRKMVDTRTQALTSASEEAEAARDAAEQANRAKSAFLANMSHEIRTPLNAVIGTTALLMETPLDQEQTELATTAQQSSEALLRLVDELLDFSRIEAGHLELHRAPLHLATLAVETLRQVAPKALRKRLSLAYYVEPCVDRVVFGDEARLRQVVLNLVVNAVNFTTEGEVGVTMTADGDTNLRLTVQDTGIGIAEEAQASLFDPFTQVDVSASRQHGGTGLGLAISQRLVSAMGGRIEVDSAIGRGTRFSIVLPFDPAPETPPAPSSERTELKGQRIVCFAPGPVGRKALSAWLETWGATAVVHDSIDLWEDQTRDAHATIIAATGWPASTRIDAVLEQQAAPRIITVGGNQTSRSARSISEPLTPDRLYNALTDRGGAQRAPTSNSVPTLARNGTGRSDPPPLSILVVDDNRVNREVATRMLRRLGYLDVRCVEDGQSALREVLREQPDVVFMDVQMPGLDGLETTRRLRQLPVDRQPRVVALTASVLDEARQACTRAGMDDFLAKPVQIKALTAALAACTPRLKDK